MSKSDSPPKTVHKAVGGARFLRHGADKAGAGGVERLAASSLSIMSISVPAPSGGGVAFPVASGIVMTWPHAGQFNLLPRIASGRAHRFRQWLQTTWMAIITPPNRKV